MDNFTSIPATKLHLFREFSQLLPIQNEIAECFLKGNDYYMEKGFYLL